MDSEQRKAEHERMRPLVDAVARRHRLLTSHDGKALTAALAELSARYNDERPSGPNAGEAQLLGARLQFSLFRDLPKSSQALIELRRSQLLPRRGPVRLLDVGAGLGATTLGALWALQADGFAGEIHITLVEPDAKALAVARELIPVLAPPSLQLRIVAKQESLATTRELIDRTFDLVLFGQVLSEDARALAAAERIVHHTDVLERALSRAVAPAGSLLVIEPALKSRTRHLHHVRDGLLARFAGGAADPRYQPVVHSPCPHQGACGALARASDWCHEDRRVDLPSWLVPIARGAGLRWQGLTFSYLLLRRDGATLAGQLGEPSARVVSDLRALKGKSELQLCAMPARLHRLECLDRDAKANRGTLWRSLARGDLIRAPRADVERGRLAADSPLERVHALGDAK